MTKRIVLIDDENSTNFLYKMMIERSSMVNEVITFDSPLAALDYFNKRPDEEKGSLILLDINMPVMNGWEFLKQYVNQNFKVKEDTVVMLTSSIDQRDHELAKENASVSDIKIKPLTLPMIKELVNAYLS